MKLYDDKKIKNIETIYIGKTEDGKDKYLTKNVLTSEQISKYAKDYYMYDGSAVKHNSDTKPPFKWEDSYIKNIILPAFKEDLGIDCEVDLLTKEEVEALPDEVRCCNDWYWTKSDATEENDKYAYAWRVYSGGDVNHYWLTGTYSVRPVLILESDLISPGNAKQENSQEENSKLVCMEKLNELEELDECSEYEELVEQHNNLINILKEYFEDNNGNN